VAYSSGCVFGCNIGELDGEVRWATTRGDILGTICVVTLAVSIMMKIIKIITLLEVVLRGASE